MLSVSLFAIWMPASQHICLTDRSFQLRLGILGGPDNAKRLSVRADREGFGRRDRRGSGRGYRSSSSSRSGGPAAPGPCGCRNRWSAGAWRTTARADDAAARFSIADFGAGLFFVVAALQAARAGVAGFPAHRPAAEALGSALPARWAGFIRRSSPSPSTVRPIGSGARHLAPWKGMSLRARWEGNTWRAYALVPISPRSRPVLSPAGEDARLPWRPGPLRFPS
jgi:hypothetical protein